MVNSLRKLNRCSIRHVIRGSATMTSNQTSVVSMTPLHYHFHYDKNEGKSFHSFQSRNYSTTSTLCHVATSMKEPEEQSSSSSSLSSSSSSSHDYVDSTLQLTPDQYDPVTTQQQIIQASQWNQGTGTEGKWNPEFCHEALSLYTAHLNYIVEHKVQDDNAKMLLSSFTTQRAIKTILKLKLPTPLLSKKIRNMERLIGRINLTPLTPKLSLRLMEANGKAGNIGRTIDLLKLRKIKQYKPIRKEFEFAIQSIVSAGLHMRKNRNLFLSDEQQPEIDNPTRWLDAILINMSERGVALDTEMANRMLYCYASTGRSGKALHFFYRVSKAFVEEEEQAFNDDDDPIDGRNKDSAMSNDSSIKDEIKEKMPIFQQRKAKVVMKMKERMPPYYKVPSEMKMNMDSGKATMDGKSIVLWQKEKEFSLSLTAAFAFADSLTHGACGHAPIKLDLTSWNTLIKACCYRGALWRALDLVENVMPQHGIKPDRMSYNTILAGLARVGDKEFMREILTTMTNNSIQIDKYTVQALVDGYLNSGDIGGAVTLVQDMFNQHRILPPYTTHLKIIEFALGNDLIYEAKRQVYFIQQLWKYEPKDGDSPSFKLFMNLTKKNPKLSKDSLKRLFAYFGEDLTEMDFF